MKLSEAMDKATPGPVKWDIDKPPNHDLSWLGNADNHKAVISSLYGGHISPVHKALLAHWYNVGPKLLEALRDLREYLESPHMSKLGNTEVINLTHETLAEAEEVDGI